MIRLIVHSKMLSSGEHGRIVDVGLSESRKKASMAFCFCFLLLSAVVVMGICCWICFHIERSGWGD